jgi:hypothetical protein
MPIQDKIYQQNKCIQGEIMYLKFFFAFIFLTNWSSWANADASAVIDKGFAELDAQRQSPKPHKSIAEQFDEMDAQGAEGSGKADSSTSNEEQRYIKEIRDYAAFGVGKKNMREEYIYKVFSNGKKEKVARRVIVIDPFELRELEVGNKNLNMDKTRPKEKYELMDSYIKLEKKIDSKAENINKNCEEVTQQYVVCNGDRYILDVKNSDGLKRDMKQIEEYIDSGKINPGTSAISK